MSTLFFAAVVLLLFGFALGPDSARLTAAAPGLLWLAIVFAGILAVGRLHQLETDDGALEHLAAYPVDRRALYAGKAIGGFAVMLVLGMVLLVAVAILFAVPVASAPIPLRRDDRARCGRRRGRRHLLCRPDRPAARPRGDAPPADAADPRPAPACGGQGTAAALSGDPFGELGAWIGLLVAFDVVMVAAGAATYGFLLEDG